MNYFAHGRFYTSDPYFLAGTAVPDWLNVVDRKIRVRARNAEQVATESDETTAAVAQGIVQHHRDDAWFHRTRAFTELSLKFTGDLRDFFGSEEGMRCHFLGHILVEILLDSQLIEQDPMRLEAYYTALKRVNGSVVSRVVTQISGRSANRLAWLLPRFIQERFLWDYPQDDTLMVRLNQVMRRVRLSPLPEGFRDLLPSMRCVVGSRVESLLSPEGVLDAQ